MGVKSTGTLFGCSRIGSRHGDHTHAGRAGAGLGRADEFARQLTEQLALAVPRGRGETRAGVEAAKPDLDLRAARVTKNLPSSHCASLVG